MKTIKKIIISLLISLILVSIFSSFKSETKAATSDIYPVKVSVTYGQTEARKMLGKINSFRTGNEAWYWNSDNKTKTKCKNLGKLKYDYNLEQIAMQRAAEIAFQFSHERTDGTSCFTCNYKNTSSYGENIATGKGKYLETATSAFNIWKEDKEKYIGQGHRRNMLSSYTSIGIGHVYYKGYHYWVQEFGFTNGTTEVQANNSKKSVSVNVLSSKLKKKSVTVKQKSIIINCKSTANVPLLSGKIVFSRECFPSGAEHSVVPVAVWKSQNEKIAKITKGKIEGIYPGKTNITATVLGKNITIPVTVKAIDIKGAKLVLNQNRFEYDKTEKKPIVSVTLNGKVLTEDDYNIIYSNNIEVGSATVTVKGKGCYAGTLTKKFEIYCEHKDTIEIDAGKPATCMKNGITEGSHCTYCNSIVVKQNIIKALGHDNDIEVHRITTTRQNGLATFTCKRCGYVLENETIYSPKTVILSENTYVYTGNAKKPKVTVKNNKGNIIDSKYYTVSYINNKNVGQAILKIKFDGLLYSGTLSKNYKIIPKPTVISSLKKKRKGFTLKIKKQSIQTTGYQIQYSTSKKFSSSKTKMISKNKTLSKTVSKLKKKKKYYVRVRTYKNVKINGKTVRIYSNWSKVKTVKTK